MKNPIIGTLAGIALAAGCAAPPAGEDQETSDVQWQVEASVQASGTEVLLQAISPVDGQVVWVSGHGGTFARTTDGGRSWSSAVMQGAETLQFRDVAAFDASTAYLMSSGSGELSRIYRTDDGGESWRLQYTASHPDAFLDCFDFWDRDRGLAYGDEVDGVPFILSTDNGGDTWTRVPREALPAAQDGEGGFAASGTCLRTGPDERAWIAAGNAEIARVFATADRGRTWSAVEVPVVAGTGAGLTSMQMDAGGTGIAVGGVIGADSIHSENVVVTDDYGATWRPGGRLAMPGPAYGSALIDLPSGFGAVAVGPRGMSWSPDGGASWQRADTLSYWAVAFADHRAGWAVGPDGRIVRLAFVRVEPRGS